MKHTQIGLSILFAVLIAPFAFAAHTSTAELQPEWSAAGQNVDYDVTINNAGPDTVDEVRVYKNSEYDDFLCDAIPDWELIFIDALDACFYVRDPDTIPSGESQEFPFSATVPEEGCNLEWRFETRDQNNVWQSIFDETSVDSDSPELIKTVTSDACPFGPGQGEECWILQSDEITVDVVDSAGECDPPSQVDYCVFHVLLDEGTPNEDEWSWIVNATDGEVHHTFSFEEDSRHDLSIECYDRAGNKAEDLNEIFRVDTNPPQTDIDLGTPLKIDNETGAKWVNHVNNVTLTADDLRLIDGEEPLCHIDEVVTYYKNHWYESDSYCQSQDECDLWEVSQDKGSYEDEDWLEYSVPFNIGQESCHVIEYWSVDGLGNREEIQWDCVYSDQTAPTIAKIVDPMKSAGECDPAANNTNTSCYVVSMTDIYLRCEDAPPHPSGHETIYWNYQFTEDGQIWNDGNLAEACDGEIIDGWCVFEGTETIVNFPESSLHRLSFYCKDAVEKTSYIDIEYFKVDNDPPNMTKTIIGPQYGDCPPAPNSDDECYIKPNETAISIFATDGDSIHAVDKTHCHWEYEWNNQLIDGGFITEFPFDIFFPEDSTHILNLICEDGLWNYVTDVETFLVDGLPPITTKTYGDPFFSCYNPLDYVDANGFPGPDGQLGLSDAVIFNDYYGQNDMKADVNNDGIIGQEDYDCAGPYYADGAPYECELDCNDWQQAPYPHWITSGTPIQLEAWDEKVGVEDTFVRVTLVSDEYCEYEKACQSLQEGEPFNTTDGTFNIPEESCHLIEFYSVDYLGNEELLNWQCVFVDNTPPNITKEIGEPKKDAGLINVTVTECEPIIEPVTEIELEDEQSAKLFSANPNLGTGDSRTRTGDTYVPSAAQKLVVGPQEIQLVSLCDSTTAPSQCAVLPAVNLPPFVQATLEAQGAVLNESCGDILVLSSGDPNDQDQTISTNMGNAGCGLNPDGFSTFDCIQFPGYSPDANMLVLAISSEWPEYQGSEFTDWMQMGGILDISINDWVGDSSLVDMPTYHPDGSGSVTLATIAQGESVDLRVADSGDAIYDTVLIVAPVSCFGDDQTTVFCGNGDIDPGEQCDDGNQENGDGCSSICLIDQPMNCTDTIVQKEATWVSMNTPIRITCEDQEPHPVGHEVVEYRYRLSQDCHNWGQWTDWIEGEVEEFYFPEDSCHELEIKCVDALGNEGETINEIDIVDTVAPETTKTLLEPFHLVEQCEGEECWTVEYIDTASRIQMEAEDPLPHPSGLMSTQYRVSLVPDEYCEQPELFCDACQAGEPAANEQLSLFDVGDVVHQLTVNELPVPGYTNYCSIGVAFDGSSLYYNRCSDSNMYEIDPITGALQDTFDTGVGLYPNAMAYDATRNGIWFGTQSCDATGMPIYFWDFSDDSVDLVFHVPYDLINPATGNSFLGFCFLDGLSFNANSPGDPNDDEIWFSDDVNKNLGVFRTNGTLVQGYDATTIDASLSSLSGLAIGGPNLYLGNNGGGDVFRADKDTLGFLDQFTSQDERLEDMECDPVTFAPTEVMWVRHTPQGNADDDLITAFAIEPGTCGHGGINPDPCGIFTTYEEPFGIPQESCHMIEYFSTDMLGNEEELQTNCLFVDKTPPAITKEYTGPWYGVQSENGTIEWINNFTSVLMSAYDQEPHPSGLADIEYRFSLVDDEYCWNQETLCQDAEGSGEWTTLDEETPRIEEESCHLIEIKATDNVGKWSLHKQCVFVDTTAPQPNKTVGEPSDPMSELNQELGAVFFPELDPEGENVCDEDGKCWDITLLTPIDLGCTDPEPHPSGATEVCFDVSFDGDDSDAVTEEYCADAEGSMNEEGYCCVADLAEFRFKKQSWHKLSYFCVDNVENEGGVDTEYFKVGETAFTIQLNKKWNLISVPVKLQDDSMDVVFEGKEDVVSTVWQFDGTDWHVYTPDGNSANDDVTTMVPGWGYWVLATNDTTLLIGGNLLNPGPISPPEVPVLHGWNLLGYFGAEGLDGYFGPAGNGRAAQCVFYNIGDSIWDKGFTTLFGYWEPYNPDVWQEYGRYDNLDPGAGYWVFATESGIHTLPPQDCGLFI